MKRIMEGLHEKGLTEIGGKKVEAVSDYLNQETTYADGRKEKIVGLPKSDVFKYFLEDKSTVCIRPSGTEPKVKFYLEVVSSDGQGMKERSDALYADLLKQLGIKA